MPHKSFRARAPDEIEQQKGPVTMETTTTETKSQCPACAGQNVPHTIGCQLSPISPWIPAIPEFLQALSLMTPVDRMKTCIVACLEALSAAIPIVEVASTFLAAWGVRHSGTTAALARARERQKTSDLTSSELDALRRLVAQHTVVGAARALGISRHSLERMLARLPVRPGTLALTRLALDVVAARQEPKP